MSNNKEELNKRISIGLEAEGLLKNELLAGLFFSIKNASCEAFMNSERGEDKKRHDLWQDVQGVIRLERELQQLVNTGKMAQDELNLLADADRLNQTNVHSPFEEGNA